MAEQALNVSSEAGRVLGYRLANNETGVVQPMAEIVHLAHSEGVIVVCDAVQALGKIPIRFDDLGVDAMVMSGHKCGVRRGGGF